MVRYAEYQTRDASLRKCGTKYIRTFKESDSDIQDTNKEKQKEREREGKEDESILYRRYLCRECARVIQEKKKKTKRTVSSPAYRAPARIYIYARGGKGS